MELRTRFPDIAIIAMSGRATAGAMLSVAQKLGAVEMLQKPFVADELRKVVERVLQGQRRSEVGHG